MDTKFPDFLHEPVDSVGRKLVGCKLIRHFDEGKVTVRIVETEAYDQDDEASHTYGGERPRSAVMFGKSGHLYVYFTYGMHHCINVVTGSKGRGAGVLIRAVEIIPGETDRGGLAILGENRHNVSGVNLTNGPAKLAQALGINLTHNGHDLRSDPLQLLAGNLQPGETIGTSPRIGISKAKDVHRRYFIVGNPYLSR